MSVMNPGRIRGMPGPMPPGERILWQGAPCWRSLAARMCHIRTVSLYWGVVVAGTAAASAYKGATLSQTLLTLAPMLIAAAAVLAILLAVAFVTARTTEYTLTNRRIVMNIGVALTATLAIPHRGIRQVAVAVNKDQTGDLPIETKPGYEVTYRRVWPHARLWHLRQAQPMLRSVPQAGALAALLARTLATAESEARSEQRLPAAAVETIRGTELLPTG